MILPAKVDEPPPLHINVFPDGGLTAPSNQHYGLPAAGIFIIDRYEDSDDANQ